MVLPDPIFYTFDQLPAVNDKEWLVKVLTYVNFLTPMVEAIRDPLFFGQLPEAGDVVYTVVAGVVSLGLGALVFTRVDDRLAAEL